MLISSWQRLHRYFHQSLSATTLLQFSIRITLVVLAVTAISYWHILSSLEEQTYDGLKNYIAERGQKESDIFKLAEENHATARKFFTDYWQRRHDSEPEDFNRIFKAFPDGTTRIPQENFDGLLRGDGSLSHDISGFVGLGAPTTDKEFQNRLAISYWMISRFGEAWGSRFTNFYVTMPENVVIGYWPGLPWGLHAEADFDITKEEWFSIATPRNNKERKSVWTGLYYDHTVDEWMVSCITPVDVDGRFLVNLGHDILLNRLFERTFNDKLEGTYNFIFRDDGRLIAHPEKTEELKKAAGQLFVRDLKDPALDSITRLIRNARAKQPEGDLLLDDTINGNILAVAHIPGPNWQFVTVYPKSLLASVALDTAHFILWLGIISLILEMIMLYIVFRKNVIRPLATFSEASGQIAQGNYQVSAIQGMPGMLKDGNEVGLLARTFQGMANDIHRSSEQLEQTVAERTEELKLAIAEARKADQAKSDFLARMSHEIRTPMNAIIGMTRLTLNTPLTSIQRGYLDKIQISADLLMGIINDILDFSKIAAGKLSMERIPFNLHEVLDNISHVISLKVESKGLELIYCIDPNVPQRLVGDPLRLGQVLINLVNNAVKFTEEGEIIVAVSIERRLDDHIQLIFSVKDTGIGLRKEEADKLFSAFTQADGSITRKYGGTGLGLAICKQLVGMMGGRIWVESQPEVGSHFIFTASFGVHEDQFVPRNMSNSNGSVRVLVVDDNETALNMLVDELETFGLEVHQATNGRDAIRMLEEASTKGAPYALVLMDWNMPEMNGIEAARRIKSNDHLSDIPSVLMVTAFAKEEVEHQAEDAGLDGYLLKPVNASTLYDSIVNVLAGNKSAVHSIRKSTPLQVKAPELEALRGARILLAEDNAINRDVVLAYLEPTGVVVDIAENGIIALEMLKAEKYQFVLMDIQMPEMDGLTAVRKIREIPAYDQLPVIAMTAHAMAGDKEISLEAGMNDHLVKPIDPDELYGMMLRWIAQQQYTPVETSLSDVLATGPELPAVLPGIDIVEASKRARRDNALLLKLMRNFYRDYENTPSRIKESLVQVSTQLSDVDKEKFRNLAHTIKPLAAYFSAHKLFDATKDVEFAFKDANLDFRAALTRFLNTLEEVLDGLQNLPAYKPEQEGQKECDVASVHVLLDKISAYLKDDNAQAESLVAKLEKSLPAGVFQDMVAKLEYLIDDVEYGEALNVVEKIRERLREFSA